ncbi:MAG: DNA polymerase II, partial [Verrucomicrobiales bacterium]|nr:DNA polymerase II [Verrucomicrobiales bacterium]
ALTTLNTGRITLPAACVGLSGRCLEISTRWAREREQWGHPIGQHAAIAEKLARMAAEHHALEATVRYISSLVDRDKHADVRLEAALAKMWGSEIAWRAVDDTLQIRGGRGFETAASLKARGETPDPVERLFRDARINTIFEGSSEIMRLFIAREVLDPHLKIGAAAVNTRLPAVQRLRAAARAGLHYLTWYPTRWLPVPLGASATPLPPDLKKDLRRIQRFSRRLSRAIFHSMARYGPALERRQLLLGTLVEIGAELFVWSCSLADAAQSLDDQPKRLRLARHFGLIARDRIAQRFAALRRGTHDMQALSLSRDLVAVE